MHIKNISNKYKFDNIYNTNPLNHNKRPNYKIAYPRNEFEVKKLKGKLYLLYQ